MSKDGEVVPGGINIRNASGFYNTLDIPNSNDKEGLVFYVRLGLMVRLLAYTKNKDGEGASPTSETE